jgi:type VI secretion system secreted protein VgrG
MADYKKADRPLTVTTPLGPDDLLLKGFTGREAISQLFSFQLDMLADNKTEVSFDKVLGQKLTVHVSMPGGGKRHFNGLCIRFAQGDRDATFTSYSAEIVPDFWKGTRSAQSRIFQHMTVPDILKKVLAQFDPTYELRGTFNERNFCVQYRESDFNFACRLMEEEGIYWFFKHSDGSHKMVVANTPDSHPDVAGKTKITYEDIETGFRDDNRVLDWEKVQELRSGKYTLWDHCFELPHKHLEADKTILDTVAVGKASHKLKLGGNDAWELYDWPGEYAQRYDGVDKGGGDRPADVQKIFDDNKRTVAIRIQQEALGSLVIRGRSNCPQMASGHKFSLDRHFSGEGGPYVLTSVQHSGIGAGDYRAGFTGEFRYENQFECIPLGLPFRTPQTTPKPVVQGTQSAVVVGPSGEEIFTDKYGRVKVQFHWDREGKHDANSSCWIRVGTSWAGKQWGAISIPRIGQEVLVDFLEGDPDQPIIIGNVYNADMMPPYALPANKTQSGVKSRSSLGGSPANFNEIRFEDKKGNELLTIHAERNQSISVEADESHSVGHDRSKTVDHDETTHVQHNRTETVDNNETISIHGNRTEIVDKDEAIVIGQNRTETVRTDESLTIGSNQTLTVAAARTMIVGAAETDTIGGALTVTVGGAYVISVGGALEIKVGGTVTISTGSTVMELKGGSAKISSPKIELAGAQEVKMGSGASSVTVKPDGVSISGPKINSSAMGIHEISGAVIKLN